MKKVVLSLSGGLDSTSLLLHFLAQGYEIFCLNFDYGQKHKIEEQKAAELICYLSNINHLGERLTYMNVHLPIGSLLESALTTKGKDIPLGHYEDITMKQTVVPNRNAIFSSIIYGYALSLANKFKQEVEIALAIHAGDKVIYPDCSATFFSKLFAAFTEGNWNSDRVKLTVPYVYIPKVEVLKSGLSACDELKLDYREIYKRTNTCYNPDENGVACSACGSCCERKEAFQLLGLIDPVEYKK